MKDNNIMKFELIRSSRKTIGLEITRDLDVLVRAPYDMHKKDIMGFIKDKSQWLEKNMAILKEEQKNNLPKFTMEEIHKLGNEALTVIPKRVEYYAPIIGVEFGNITIRNQISRWGSCSGKGNLNFNCLLMLTPPKVLDYIVVHELCHRKQMNHSLKFWDEVSRILPDYKTPKKWLEENGSALIQRLR